MEIRIEFHVREIRQERGLSVRQLADLSGVSRLPVCYTYEGKIGLDFG